MKEKIKKAIIPCLYVLAIVGFLVIRLITGRNLFAITYLFFVLGIVGVYTFISETKRKLPILFGTLEMGSIVIFIRLFAVIYTIYIEPYVYMFRNR